MKDAMAAMKAELGDEAVILHSKKYKEGGLLGIGSREVVEITAAVEENSMPRRIETPRLTHPTVKPNSLLTRYKTDGTAQGVANAEQAAEYETPRPTLFNGSQSRSMQIDGLADRVAAQKNRQSDSQRNFDDMLESAKENNFAVDLNANNPETVPAYNQPVEKISSVETPPPAQENISDVETPPPAQENISSVETPPPAQENISDVETPPPAQENISDVETPPPAQENIPRLLHKKIFQTLRRRLLLRKIFQTSKLRPLPRKIFQMLRRRLLHRKIFQTSKLRLPRRKIFQTSRHRLLHRKIFQASRHRLLHRKNLNLPTLRRNPHSSRKSKWRRLKQ